MMVHLFIDICFLIGVSLVSIPLFYGRRRTRIQRRFWVPQRRRTQTPVQHLERLLAISVGNRFREAKAGFWIVSVGLGVMTLLAALNAGASAGFSLFVAFVFGTLPYGVLRLRLYLLQVAGSHEGETLLTELTNQYKIHHFNMREAIQATISRLIKEPCSRRALFRLASALSTARGAEQIAAAIDTFHLSFDTQWSALLAQNMELALTTGLPVTEGLADGMEELRSLTRMREDEAQGHAESFLLALFVTPLLYLGSLFLFFRAFGFSTAKFISYQFHNPAGLRMFLLIFIFSIGNLLVYVAVRRGKNDF